MITAMCGIMLQWSTRTAASIKDSKAWPTAQGTVISSQALSDSSRIKGGGYNHYYTVDVTYKYLVNGNSYQSNVFVFGIPKSFADSAEAQSVVAAHPVNGNVTVYYDPADPGRSCLEPGTVPPQFGLITLMSGGFLLVGLLLLISGGFSVARSRLVDG
jgi:hypothetical protein